MNKALTALATAGVAVLALSGCSGASPGAVATVDGATLTQVQVDRAAQALAQSTQNDVTKATQAVVTNEVLGRVAQKVAADNKITLDAAARAGVLDPQTAALRDDPALTGLVDRFADLNVVTQKLGYEGFVSACQKVPVTVNPRYGEWSPELCQLTANGSLSKPAPTGAAR